MMSTLKTIGIQLQTQLLARLQTDEVQHPPFTFKHKLEHRLLHYYLCCLWHFVLKIEALYSVIRIPFASKCKGESRVVFEAKIYRKDGIKNKILMSKNFIPKRGAGEFHRHTDRTSFSFLHCQSYTCVLVFFFAVLSIVLVMKFLSNYKCSTDAIYFFAITFPHLKPIQIL